MVVGNFPEDAIIEIIGNQLRDDGKRTELQVQEENNIVVDVVMSWLAITNTVLLLFD